MEGEFTNDLKVWVNGTFDVFHPGHLALLKYAAGKGELHVGIDSDRRVQEKKGPNRPVFNEKQRRELLESLKFVKKVYTFDSDEDLMAKIKESKAIIMVIGSDYEKKTIIGQDLFRGIIFFNRIQGISSTEILNYTWNNSDKIE
jgi:D-beta-D-heptose 7-phosphate kinase/D-beta-D-heptose 1-phosphate adenosyltransferase